MSESTEKDGRTPIIESASATTDPENSNSGSGAYVVFLVVACLLLALVSSMSSCVGGLANVARETAERKVDNVELRLFNDLGDCDATEDLFSTEPVSRT